MLEVKVPKDIRAYETKIIGTLTVRQSVCVLGALAASFLAYSFILEPLQVPLDYDIYIITFVAMPFMFFMIPNIGGMKPEKYLRDVLWRGFCTPTKRAAENVIVKRTYAQPKLSRKRRKELKKLAEADAGFRAYD